MKMVKVIVKMFLLMLIVLSINVVSVQADNTNGAIICVDGYKYFFQASKDSFFDFSSLVGINLKELNIDSNNITSGGTIVKNGTELNYSFYGMYSANTKLNVKCYTYVENSGVNTDVSQDDKFIYENSSQTYRYQTKQCGNKYGLISENLIFKTNDISNNIIVSNDADGSKKQSLIENYTTNVINSDGTITIIIKPQNNILESVWGRLSVSVEYDGTLDLGKNGKGKCKVYGSSNGSINDDYIECSGITPYQVVTDKVLTDNVKNDTQEEVNKIINNSTYQIHFYLNGVEKIDFNEDVSDEEKAKYVASCGGANGSLYIGNMETKIISQDKIALPNPKNTNKNIADMCNQVYAIKGDETLKKTYIFECYDSKVSYSTYMNMEEKVRTKLDILNAMYKGVDTNEWLAVVAKKDKLLCTNNSLGIPATDSVSVPFESKVVYEESNGYWGVVCTENYYVDAGDPSLVKAGTGVDYSNKVQIDKTCNIFLLKQVTKAPQCENYYGGEIRFDHDGDGVFTAADMNGGPNQGFDSCVETCDGGKYSQQCINYCYSLNYSDSRSDSISSVLKNNFDFSKKFNLSKINNSVDGNYSVSEGELFKEDQAADFNMDVGEYNIGGGYKLIVTSDEKYTNEEGWSCEHTSTHDCLKAALIDPNGNVIDEAGTSTICNATGGVFISSYSGPEGCSDNPKVEYDREIEALKLEYANLLDLISKDSQLEEYSISLTDTLTGYDYEVTGSTTKAIEDRPNLVITKDLELSVKESNTVQYDIGSDGDKMPGVSMLNVTTVYDVKLPTAKVSKTNAEQIIVENSNLNSYYSYSQDKNNKYKFTAFNGYNASLFTNGQNVYYTNFDSPNYNVFVNSGKTEEQLKNIDHFIVVVNGEKNIYELIKNSENIKVSLKIGADESGWKSFDSTNLYCYYGVYNGFLFGDDEIIVLPEGGGGSDPEPTPIPTHNDNSKGLKYYYREIYLNPDENGYGGIFPNGRSPRWNWTGTITNGVASGAANNDDPSYIVDPVRLIEDIEVKGDSIFTDQSEYDYVFVMTPEIISKIRKYNNTKIDGRKITYLDFSLVGASDDKRNYSQVIADWYSNLSPSVLVEISGCNNAKNGKC